MSAAPQFTMKQLLEAGVHYGHRTMRWNPRMGQYIYGSRNDVHILDLQQTVPLLHQSLQAVYDVVSKNGRVLFVGTKRQASEILENAATRCGQYYVNHRWLGGMLTNWKTVSQSIKALDVLEEQLANPALLLSKKERLEITRKKDKLERSLGGIRTMGGVPDLLFVIDTNKESLAVEEAKKLGIPIIAILDSNSNPEGIDFPVPGNDDAIRAIKLYCQLMSDAALSGIETGLVASGVDVGAMEQPPAEAVVETEAKADPTIEVVPVVTVETKKEALKKTAKKEEAKPAKAAAAKSKEAEATKATTAAKPKAAEATKKTTTTTKAKAATAKKTTAAAKPKAAEAKKKTTTTTKAKAATAKKTTTAAKKTAAKKEA